MLRMPYPHTLPFLLKPLRKPCCLISKNQSILLFTIPLQLIQPHRPLQHKWIHFPPVSELCFIRFKTVKILKMQLKQRSHRSPHCLRMADGRPRADDCQIRDTETNRCTDDRPQIAHIARIHQHDMRSVRFQSRLVLSKHADHQTVFLVPDPLDHFVCLFAGNPLLFTQCDQLLPDGFRCLGMI